MDTASICLTCRKLTAPAVSGNFFIFTAQFVTAIMLSLKLPQKLYYILRVASAMCFIGHGAFGIITKQIWCNYFAVFGIQEKPAYQLMPVVGVVDIVFGLILLFYPIRFVAAWLVGWGTFNRIAETSIRGTICRIN